jgi:hypothetical protein
MIGQALAFLTPRPVSQFGLDGILAMMGIRSWSSTISMVTMCFDITLSSNKPPKYSVFFGGPGKSVTWWLDRLGSGSFTERIYYDKNGVPSKHEVWYDDAWHLVDRRDGTNGMVIDEQWRQLAIGTNQTWTIKPPSTNQF